MIHAGKIASQQLVLDAVTLFFFNDRTQFTSRIDAQAARLENGDWVSRKASAGCPTSRRNPLKKFVWRPR